MIVVDRQSVIDVFIMFFLCPDGHEECKINPVGFQWFDLTKDDPIYILEESKKAERKLQKYIEEVKSEYNLINSQICLSGFSQGCMMSINLGLTANQNYNCIVGFSGKIINQDDLSKRKSSTTKMLLIHGDQDAVVSPTFLLDAKDFLIRNNIEVKISKNSNKQVVINVIDEGLGFKEKDTSKIFKRFYSNRPDKFGQHSGLGLNIVKNLIELHRASIFAFNRIDKQGANIEIIFQKL